MTEELIVTDCEAPYFIKQGATGVSEQIIHSSERVKFRK